MRKDQKKPKSPRFVRMLRVTMKGREWQKLSSAAKVLYLHLKCEFNGFNNGKLRLPYKTLQKMNGMKHPATISRAYKELIDKEWIEKTKHGGLCKECSEYLLIGKHDHDPRIPYKPSKR